MDSKDEILIQAIDFVIGNILKLIKESEIKRIFEMDIEYKGKLKINMISLEVNKYFVKYEKEYNEVLVEKIKFLNSIFESVPIPKKPNKIST